MSESVRTEWLETLRLAKARLSRESARVDVCDEAVFREFNLDPDPSGERKATMTVRAVKWRETVPEEGFCILCGSTVGLVRGTSVCGPRGFPRAVHYSACAAHEEQGEMLTGFMRQALTEGVDTPETRAGAIQRAANLCRCVEIGMRALAGTWVGP